MSTNDAPKYDDLNNRYPGDFRAGDIILYGYNGTQFDISGLTAVVNVYQNLDSPFFQATFYSLTQWVYKPVYLL